MEKEKLLDNISNIANLSDFFKVLSNDTRLKILLLLDDKSLCVEEISLSLNMTSSAISHQLRILKNSRYVKSEKKGQYVYYSIDDIHIFEIINNALLHIKHQ